MKGYQIKFFILILAALVLIDCRDETRADPYFSQLKVLVDAGDAPDVGYVDSIRAPELIEQGVLKEIPSDIGTDDYYPQLLRYFQRDGKTYALPRDFQTVALLVNLDLFDKAGASLPNDWDSFRQAAQKITELGDDIHGVGLTSGFFNFAPFLFQADPNPFDDKGTQINLQTDSAKASLTFYTDLYKNGYAYDPRGVWPYMGIYDQNGLIDQFVTGKIGMFLVGPSMYEQALQRANGKIRMEVIELPAGPAGKATIAYVVGFGLYNEPTDAAKQLLDYVVSPEGMKIWFNPSELGLKPPTNVPPVYMPARISMRQEWINSHPDATAFMNGIDYVADFSVLRAPYTKITEFDQNAGQIIRGAVDNKLSIDEALSSLQELSNEFLKQYAVPR